ncbi:transcription factor bHLH121 isoform X2 [Lycium ferocissimum]|uniref:transcription factor bHLH121 isoform X2 n=1 Tax=Lycium ferocissimum TaxID=112874 RepID=UPI002815917D|nr:transcription factor bHLH121 isoform X2 [Lycium ferocissimum]
MDQLNHGGLYQANQLPNHCLTELNQLPNDVSLPPNGLHSESSKQNPEAELKDSIAARKVQKADREKLRRERLNEQFIELGKTLDPDRPKNDKASILCDTVQMLRDLTSQVSKLKSEYAALTDESRELTQEKNDLREEKASLKSDIESLNAQYQQRVRTMYPWAGMDPSMVMHPPSYSYPMPVPVPTGPVPMHPSMQPYPFFSNQNHAVVPNPCSSFVQYMTPNRLMEQQPTQYMSPIIQPGSMTRQESRNKSSDQGDSRIEKSEDSNEVATNLELKTPGSTSEQDLSSGQKKCKKLSKKDNTLTDGSSSSRCSSSHSVQAVSSNSVVKGTKTDD